MTVLTADNALQAYLAAITERTEIRDSSGRLLGVFMPAIEKQPVDYDGIRRLFDPEEIKRRKERSRNEPGVPLDQIMVRIHSLEKGK